ncbi:TetR/AcrR family transcriptional regulator [Pseudoxanthomonas sp.]|uniref:TetR/AcrR family transcriptional regulator n=1 Tax=Pseudoxanthomonas sp. TaxID=1871049 RepID=UPI003F7F25BC
MSINATSHSGSHDRASTNRIAQAAGVSIGSLYQYFPSKEALVAGVIDLHMQEMMQRTRDALTRVAQEPLEPATRELVRVMIDAHRINPRLHRVLAEQTPRVGLLENVGAIEHEIYTLVRRYLETHREVLRVQDLDTATFIAVSTVEALTHAAVVQGPEMVSGDRADAYIDEVTALLVRYLRKV